MPYNRPTLERLVTRAVHDIEGVLRNGASLIRRSFERAVATAIGGIGHTLHGHIAYGIRQILILTADEDFLVMHGEMWGQPRKQAEAAEFTVGVRQTTLGGPDITLEAGTVLSRADGALFEVTLDTDIPSTLDGAEVLVRALEPGFDGNTEAGTVLSFVSPVAGISSVPVVQGSGLVGGGADIEPVEVFRTRLLDYIADPPKGGAAGDYVKWAKEVAGVTRAWEAPGQLGPGSVALYFVQDLFNDDGTFDETVFPDVSKVEEVEEHIEGKKPLTAVFGAFAPVALPLNPTIQLLPNNATVRAQVTDALQDLILREGRVGGLMYRSWIQEAIASAPDEISHILVSPAGNVQADVNELITLGTITFQDVP